MSWEYIPQASGAENIKYKYSSDFYKLKQIRGSESASLSSNWYLYMCILCM